MTEPVRRTAFRDALAGRDGTHAVRIPVVTDRAYWDPTSSVAPPTARVAPPLPALSRPVIDPRLFAVTADGEPIPPPATPAPVPPARQIGVQQRPARPARAVPPARPVAGYTAPVATYGGPALRQATPTATYPAPTGYAAPILPAGPPAELQQAWSAPPQNSARSTPIPPQTARPARSTQELLRQAMRAAQKQPAQARNTATAKGCASVMIWMIVIVIALIVMGSGALSSLLDTIFK